MRQMTAAAKGEAISGWELAEVHLSRLFAAVSEDKIGVTSKLYGEPSNFKDRLDKLKRTGESYFYKNCDQVLEGDFDDIILLAQMLSLRRNEIVHSIIQGVIFDRKSRREGDRFVITAHARFFIVPPTYTSRKWDPLNQPSFIYSSKEIDRYAEWFMQTGTAALNLAHRISGSELEPFGRKHPESQS